MRKTFFVIMLAAFTLVVAACSSSSEKKQDQGNDEKAEVNAESASGFTTYENKEYGFSIAYPPICHPQNNDAEMEKSFRGRLFIGESAMLTGQCLVKDDGTAYSKDYFDMQYEFAAATSDGAKLAKNEKSDTEFTVKSANSEMVYNQHVIFKNGRLYRVDYTYPVSVRDKHDKYVDEVLASLKVK